MEPLRTPPDLGEAAVPAKSILPSTPQGRSQSSRRQTHLAVDSVPELALLSSAKLNACKTFKAMKSSLECFYLDPERCQKQHPCKSRQWVTVLYSELFRSLYSLTYESDPATQESQLASIYQWFVKKTGLVRPVTAVTAQDFFLTSVRESTPTESSPAPRPKQAQQLSLSGDNPRSCSQTRKQSTQDDRLNRILTKAYERQQFQDRSARFDRRLLTCWSRTKSRIEETRLAKYERRAQARAPSEPHTPQTPTAATEGDSITLQQPKTVLCYVQPEPSNASYEEYDPEEHQSAILSRIQRLRAVHRDLHQDVCSTGYYYRNLPSLSVYHPRTLRRPDKAAKGQVEREEEEERGKHKTVEEVRRRLVHNKVACTYRAIQQGLKQPQGLSSWQGTKLPEGGEYLTSNPFFPVKNTDKGKKSKSK